MGISGGWQVVAGYFAFGSNMNPRRVQARGLRWTRIEAAALTGVELVFDKRAGEAGGAGHANLRFARGGCVHGLCYELEDATQIARMDRFENAPINYSREVFWVRTVAGDLPAWTYIGNEALLCDGLSPARDYMAHLLEGRPWLPPDYYELLRRWPCLPQLN